MIIIKIIFLYFIEIAHTDDFASTGTRLVYFRQALQPTPVSDRRGATLSSEAA